ncbi:solute carrier family 2, facilitated glucose transporter member 2-like [Ostrinia furnacalis]|uniref:solute carrier family 2, facilitated glucose transporter member 2-like n=1 Tax=Ostrinia furnacalis TaxID=93504 RepID=UPI00103CFE93|nr:solute carrier family 2, facilitated glucose transporter member 2-like [Ostrinia furnacalis]
MGIDSISVFANQVFHEADPSKADLCSVLLAMVWCCANLLSGVLSDRIGRRPLLIGSSYLVAACLVTLGVLLQTRIAPAWVTATCIMLYCFFFMLGAGTVPYMLLAEVFNPKVQTLASMLITEWIWLVGFVILAVFNWLNRLIGIHATFYIFAFNALFNATFSYFLVPETKGLSNKEIQVALLKGRRK